MDAKILPPVKFRPRAALNPRLLHRPWTHKLRSPRKPQLHRSRLHPPVGEAEAQASEASRWHSSKPSFGAWAKSPTANKERPRENKRPSCFHSSFNKTEQIFSSWTATGPFTTD